MLNIVLFGPPGAGKGTQATMLAQKYGLTHISTGEVIREEISRGSELGESMKEYIARGELAPDELVISIIADYMENHRGAGSIFDGFPRTINQAEEFDRILEGHGVGINAMISLDVPEDELVQRIKLRGIESGRPDDFSEEVIRHRIDVYNERTCVVADYYARQGKHIGVNGLGTLNEVFDRLGQIIDPMLK